MATTCAGVRLEWVRGRGRRRVTRRVGTMAPSLRCARTLGSIAAQPTPLQTTDVSTAASLAQAVVEPKPARPHARRPLVGFLSLSLAGPRLTVKYCPRAAAAMPISLFSLSTAAAGTDTHQKKRLTVLCCTVLDATDVAVLYLRPLSLSLSPSISRPQLCDLRAGPQLAARPTDVQSTPPIEAPRLQAASTPHYPLACSLKSRTPSTRLRRYPSCRPRRCPPA